MSAPLHLYVAWRDPASRRIFPVGRLRRIEQPFEGYEFVYIEEARAAAERGFRPFLAFADLDEVYRSEELPAFFKNRVMSPSRPDYEEYVESLALTRATAEPMTLLAWGNGLRVTDQLEVFPEPTVDAEAGVVMTRFLVRGVQHIPGAEEHIAELAVGARLRCLLDVQNEHNARAVALRTDGHAFVGYCPDYLVDDVSVLLEQDRELEIRVVRVNPPPQSRHHRLMCELRARASADYVAFCSTRFRPIAREDGAVQRLLELDERASP